MRHTSEVLAEHPRGGRLEARVTCHDPRYLGRHHGLTAAPRAVLAGIEGLERVEMAHHGADSLCCCGGGRVWQEELGPETPMPQRRIAEALGTGASVLVTACPLCLIMLNDARISAGLAERLEVLDLSERVLRATIAERAGEST